MVSNIDNDDLLDGLIGDELKNRVSSNFKTNIEGTNHLFDLIMNNAWHFMGTKV